MRRAWQAYALLAPFFILILVFMYYPPVLGFVRSFYQWKPGAEAVYVGLENFHAYFTHPETGRELRNLLTIMVLGWVTGTVVPFLMAELIFSVRAESAKRLYRTLVTIPFLAPGIVVILLWKKIYDPQLGPINAVLGSVGLEAWQRNWLGDPEIALYAIVGVGFPWVATIGTLIYLGGLGQISASIYDASLIDGCTGLRRIVQLDLPQVLGQVRLLTILSVVAAVTAFDTILVLTDGGPGFATMVPALRMYKRAFTAQQFGYASAIGLMLFLVAIAVTFAINRIIRREE
jgi:ABC-type sugar transport system permease subunit